MRASCGPAAGPRGHSSDPGARLVVEEGEGGVAHDDDVARPQLCLEPAPARLHQGLEPLARRRRLLVVPLVHAALRHRGAVPGDAEVPAAAAHELGHRVGGRERRLHSHRDGRGVRVAEQEGRAPGRKSTARSSVGVVGAAALDGETRLHPERV